MSTDFNWQTDEDDWGREPVSYKKEERPKRRWWPAALVLIFIVGIIAFLIYSQAQKQIEAAVTDVETDVRRTHELVLQAAGRRDRDLLHSMISSRDDDWLDQQLQLAEEGLLYNPRPFGLVAQNEAVPEYGYEISADLSAAEVVVTRTFAVQSPTGLSETVALKQHALYRRGQNRWLYSPPLDWEVFWQEEDSIEGQYVTITYPKRDAKEVGRLLGYLDKKVIEMCTGLPDFDCPNELHIRLELATESVSLSEMQDLDSQFENTSELTLPTISLVGVPTDEAAREALHRAYAVQVVRRAMVQALDWECCPQGLFFRALMDYQLAELNIRAFPIYPVDYEKLFAQFQNIDQLVDYWRLGQLELVDGRLWQWPYAATEFLLSTTLSDKTAGAMQQSLLSTNNYIYWLEEVLTVNSTDITLRQAWLNFIYNNSLSGRVAVGTYKPHQDILLACDYISSPQTRLFRYSWEAGEWLSIDEFEEQAFFMMATPEDSAVVFQSPIAEGPGSTFMWRDGQLTTLLDGTKPEQAGYYFIGSMAPDGRALMMFNQEEEGFFLLDIEDCRQEGCQLQSLPGNVVWSPNGSQFIIEQLSILDDFIGYIGLSRFDNDEKTILISESGFSPFWLNEEEYGFVTMGEESAVYAARTADDDPYLLIFSDAFLQLLPEEKRPETILIQDVTSNPANRNILGVIAGGNERGKIANYLFFWNLRSGEISHISTIDWVNVGSISWLPGGEWLVVSTFNSRLTTIGDFAPWSYYLFHISGEGQPIELRRNQDLAFSAFDYSFDGDWLVLARPEYLEVVGLNHTVIDHQPYRYLLPHNFGNCRHVLFIL